jgi:hypothetical protein
MNLSADPGLTRHIYSAEVNSPTADALSVLASWAATTDQEAAAPEDEAGQHRP